MKLVFRNWIYLFLVLASGFFFSSALSDEPLNSNLEKWVGAWQYNSSEYEENWTLNWNEERTHLNLIFSSYEAGNPSFKGSGYVFFDQNTSRFHFYLMMNNGALHENIGLLKDDGKYHLLSKTYGGPGFPDHNVVIAFEGEKMIVEYVYEEENGEIEIYTNLFLRKSTH